MVNACVVGLSGRGYSLVNNVLVNNSDINIVAVCDGNGISSFLSMASIFNKMGFHALGTRNNNRFYKLES